MDDKKVLEVKNVIKKYNNLDVINDISFDVKEGETLVILGASGSGKSTLLRCINNLEKIDGGNIKINGKELVKEYKNNKPIYNNKKILESINLDTGMVFQDFNLFPHLSVKENITESLRYVKKMSKIESEKIAEKLLVKMGLEEKSDSYPCDLSGGQKQRVSIARCLAINPKIICMDEPTSALDPELVGEVLKVIKELASEKRTMIIVTHEIKFAEEVADRIIFMDKGKIVEEGKNNEIIKNPKNKRTKEFLKRYIDFFEEEMKKLDVDKEEPKKVLKYFEEISKIPRKSGNEEKIKEYLIKFAKDRNLDFYEDEFCNVIISKRRNEKKKKIKKEPICLQAHTDMICEKTQNSKHDFNVDPIILYKENGYIRAKDTTLGADNGIGVAQILAIFDSEEEDYPDLEAIFTSQEETTMIGAKELDLNKIKSKKIISLDGGREGKILVGAANCMEWSMYLNKEYTSVQKEYEEYELNYSNFKGGHSGGNIGDENRGNPIKLGIEILKKIGDLYIYKINAGSRPNVIPRDFSVRFFAKINDLNNIEKLIQKQRDKYDESSIELKKIIKNKENIDRCLTKEISDRIINFINEYENGVIEKKEELIILSCNMAGIKEDNEKIFIEFSTRANDLKLRNEYLERLDKLIEKYDIKEFWKQELKGVIQNSENDLITRCNNVYKKMYGKELEKIVSQGTVEGGFFMDKKKDIEYVCIGPNTEDVHSPNERLSIESLKKTWEYLNEVLKY